MKYWQRKIKIHSLTIILVLLIAQICVANIACAQTFSFEGNRKKSFVNFQLIKNLIIIPLYINGKGPYNFILDTGVGPLIITEPALMDTLELKNLRTTKIYGVGEGGEIPAFLTSELSVTIKEATIQHIPTAILKEDVFNLSSYVGKKIHGIIGYYFFNSFVVKISYSTQRIVFSSPLEKARKRGVKFPLEIQNKKPYIIVDMVTPQQKNIKAKLIIDCGASHALSMEALDGAAFPLPDSIITANLGIGLSGPISGHVGRIPLLKLGKFSFKNIISGFPSFESVAAKIGYGIQDGNLGAEFLRRFDATYDYQNAAIYLKPNQGYRADFDHDMSGIEVYIDPNNSKRYFIGRIEKGSPADKAGFLEQDEIISLDFKWVLLYSLEEITNLFKSDDGKTVVVEIIRGDKNIVKLLKLKRRV
ncbi:peptide-binding protein [Pedobacter polaris]|uniref:Peptide-binding protein n=1 Tax=Pedobacter polaris TaxID=2571273 RepID=A0A4U1CWH1_9SPHI|nr:aspartyl protease family protein [Pedobacter polaris]TKC12635.1 peptide-binding protein [Pedobacter polaris]